MEVIDTEIEDLEELLVLSKDNTTELNELKNQLSEVEQKIKDLEEESLYSEEFDNHSAVLTVNAGAGGVDAHDWAEILLRMYTRFLDENDMKYEIEEISSGEEAGIKSASIRVDNFRAYGNLESGIKILEQLYEREPIPMSDINTDRMNRELFLAYYLDKNYKKCEETFNKINECTFREWLINIDIKS